MMKLKKCSDCKHAHRHWLFGWDFAECRHPDSVRKTSNRAHLGLPPKPLEYQACSTMRQDYAECKSTAVLFAARK